MKKQRSFYGIEEGIKFSVLASKKPDKETEKAIREMVKKVYHMKSKRIVTRPEELSAESLKSMTRNDVVPIYVYMLKNDTHNDQIARINQLIINRWSIRGLIYIKEKAWKIYDPDGKKFSGGA